MSDCDYQGGYTAVYPIKVNQQRRVVEEILATASAATAVWVWKRGSKPELLAVLALSDGGSSLIVCNGYKDREYVRLALLGEKLGHKVYLVVEKLSELQLILEEARELDVTPRIGLRARPCLGVVRANGRIPAVKSLSSASPPAKFSRW
ncbi:hypothetical protein [Halomonas sp. PA16-9]|uniref:hypothetical protein n=1 Tax=Halomonas sp. PA16-9 TaxID=2576841 RepID=UPI0030EBEF6B